MIRVLLLKRGSTPKVSVYRGPEGELVYDKGMGTLRIQDGLTTGGHPLYVNGARSNKPTIISPTNGTLDLPRQVSLKGSTFTGNGEHTASRWMVFLNVERTELYHDSGWVTSGDITEYAFDAPKDTRIYVQLMYQIDDRIHTAWSTLVSYRTNSQWMTFYTAQRQTSHMTEFSRTTYVEVNTGVQTSVGRITRRETEMPSMKLTSHQTQTRPYTRSVKHIDSFNNTTYTWHYTAAELFLTYYSTASIIRRNTSWEVQEQVNTTRLTEKPRLTSYNGLTYYETDFETSAYVDS